MEQLKERREDCVFPERSACGNCSLCRIRDLERKLAESEALNVKLANDLSDEQAIAEAVSDPE